MTAPATRLPGAVSTAGGTGFTGGGGVAAGGTCEWPDLSPPDDAAPITLTFGLIGQGPGVLSVYRASRGGAPGPLHQPAINIPAVPPTEEYVLVFDYPIPGALRVTYRNDNGAEVFPALSWAYVSPGRR